jgi:hypothetical protein
MPILIKITGELSDISHGKNDVTAGPEGNSLISYDHWDLLCAEKGSEAAVIAAMKATDTRQESEKRPVPVAAKIAIE